MIFVGLKRYFISTISNHSLSVQLRVLTAETMEISASLNKLVVVKGQAGSTTEAVLFRSIFCKIRWEQQVSSLEKAEKKLDHLRIFLQSTSKFFTNNKSSEQVTETRRDGSALLRHQ